VELIRGEGAVGVRLKANDGSEDLVGFRTDPQVQKVRLADLESEGRVFAEGKNAQGKLSQRFYLE
ncbi:MAG: hypothetical protein WBH86_16770, partial [Thermogutta sp.]